jgi:phosphoribosyl 1,2-cyclic phosphodiesterase
VRVVSLGSGSSGNALVAQAGPTAVLLDAGFSVRTLVSRLRQASLAPEQISAILLTHEHHDHSCGAVAFAHRYGVPLIANPRTLAAVLAAPARGQAEPLTRGSVERVELAIGQTTAVGALRVRSFPVSHDAIAPCGYVVSSGAWRLCFVTDTGMISEPIIEAMAESSLLMVESNHDRDRLLNGPYPWHLKQRILSPTGHLSNAQTTDALLRVLDDAPRWVWLGHLSRTNNTPDLARAHLRERLRHVGLRHIEPQVSPPSVGAVWDSATLWGPAFTAPAAPDSRERPPGADAESLAPAKATRPSSI